MIWQRLLAAPGLRVPHQLHISNFATCKPVQASQLKSLMYSPITNSFLPEHIALD